MKHKLFIFSCMLSIIIEYCLVFIFFNKLLKLNFIISLIITLVILALLTVIMFFSSKAIVQGDTDVNEKPCEKELMEIINKTNKLYNKQFELHYTSVPILNPAFCLKNCVYINLSEKIIKNKDNPTYSLMIDEIFLPGVVAHELGHAISGLTKYSFLATVKPLYVLSSYLLIMIHALIGKKNIVARIFNYLFVGLYTLITLPYQILVFPFIRNEEITANSIAASLGYGNDLRSYYKLTCILDGNENRLLRFVDFLHPSPALMVNKLNKDLKISNKKVDYFTAKNHLIYVETDTLTLKIPNNVEVLLNKSINGDHLLKLTGDNVKVVYPLAFNNCINVEKIILPNVEEFSVSCLSKLKNLKEIKINNINILRQIYNRYPDREFSKSIKKILDQNIITSEDKDSKTL